MPGPLRPLVMRREGDRLAIEWNDGRSGVIPWRSLRRACPCATCREEREKPPDPFRLLSERELAAGDPEPVAMAAVGHYAYKVTWNDGHDAGIFTIENLRELCEPE